MALNLNNNYFPALNGALNEIQNAVNALETSVTWSSTDGDITSALELDPAENINGTRFYTEDTGNENLSQIYLSPEYIELQSNDSNFSIYASNISTSFNPGGFGGNDSVGWSLQAANLDNAGSAAITGSVDLVTDESNISIVADIILIQTLPTYADNAAAVSGGLDVGTLYSTATGELRIVV